MPSQALIDFRHRLKEVQQLVEARDALIRYKNAMSAYKAGGPPLRNVLQIVQMLAASPKAGRPPVVQALNSSGVALLSAHFQGFVSDLYKEVAHHTLDGKVKDFNIMISSAEKRGNPNVQNITRLFSSIGYPDILNGISWQRMSNKQLLGKITALNELRNKIVHGSSDVVKKSTLMNFLNILVTFADKFDKKLRIEVKSVTRVYPW